MSPYNLLWVLCDFYQDSPCFSSDLDPVFSSCWVDGMVLKVPWQQAKQSARSSVWMYFWAWTSCSHCPDFLSFHEQGRVPTVHFLFSWMLCFPRAVVKAVSWPSGHWQENSEQMQKRVRDRESCLSLLWRPYTWRAKGMPSWQTRHPQLWLCVPSFRISYPPFFLAKRFLFFFLFP